jgi:hypothetical protein
MKAMILKKIGPPPSKTAPARAGTDGGQVAPVFSYLSIYRCNIP